MYSVQTVLEIQFIRWNVLFLARVFVVNTCDEFYEINAACMCVRVSIIHLKEREKNEHTCTDTQINFYIQKK